MLCKPVMLMEIRIRYSFLWSILFQLTRPFGRQSPSLFMIVFPMQRLYIRCMKETCLNAEVTALSILSIIQFSLYPLLPHKTQFFSLLFDTFVTLHLFARLPTVYISHEGIVQSVLFIIASPMGDGRWSIITGHTNDCVSCRHSDTHHSWLQSSDPSAVYNTSRVLPCTQRVVSQGSPNDWVKAHPRMSPHPPRCSTPGSGPDPRQHLAALVPASVLTASPSGPLVLQGTKPIRYAHFPELFGQPFGLDSQALSQPWEWAPEEQRGLPGHKHLSLFPEKKMFHSVASL